MADAGAPASLHESFETVADGPAPSALVDGSAAVENYGSTPGAAPFVRGGRLTMADTTTGWGGAYRIAQLGGDVTAVGATFALTPYRQRGGVLCLSIQATSIGRTPSVPVSPMHLVIDAEQWGVDVNAEGGTAVENIAGGELVEPLVADGSTLYTIKAELDRSTATVRVTLPDGSVKTVTHPGLALPGTYVYVEPFKTPGALTEKSDALVSEWWATTAPVPVQPTGEQAPRAAAAPAAEVAVSTGSVSPALAAPSRPGKVRAVRDGRKVAVSWRASSSADRYVVRCGRIEKSATGRRATLRSTAGRCAVHAVNDAGASSAARVRVRR